MTPEVEQLIDHVFYEPEKITIAASGTSADGVTQLAYLVPNYNTKLHFAAPIIKRRKRVD